MKRNYTEEWKVKGIEILSFDYFELVEGGVEEESAALLAENGLPKAVAPGLNFRKNDINASSSAEEKYLCLGFTANGDDICLEKKNGRIVSVDHENNLTEVINCSLQKMYESILCYKKFIDSICNKNGQMAFIEKLFMHADVDKLRDEIAQIDNLAMQDNMFWSNRIISLHESLDE